MGYLDKLLIERENPYAIDVELEIRKIFERETNYIYEFQKNENPYDYDITVFKYYINGANWWKKIIAYIELEVSEHWINDYPKYWKTYSFLKRKIYEWDNGFSGEKKCNADKTIYIIFNKQLNDAICCDIETISKFQEEYINITGSERKDTFLRTSLDDPRITRGIRNCIERIKYFIKQKE